MAGHQLVEDSERQRAARGRRAPASTVAPPCATRGQLDLLTLQRTIGNRATSQLMRTAEPSIQRSVVTIGGEKVDLGFSPFKQKARKAEAEGIIRRIKDDYGFDLSSTTTVEALRAQYGNVPDKVKKRVKARSWRLVELQALERALSSYAPILGSKRATSTRSGVDQEATSVGKVAQAIDRNTPAGKLDTTTLGEFFSARKTMGLFKAAEGDRDNFDDPKDQLVGTFVHEIAHGLLSYAIPDFIAATGGYWTDRNTKSGIAGTEAPITDYGATNASEDLCEAAMFYFVDPTRLRRGDGEPTGTPGNGAPLRHAFMQQIGKNWLPPPAEAPQVQGTGTTTGPVGGGTVASPALLKLDAVITDAPQTDQEEPTKVGG